MSLSFMCPHCKSIVEEDDDALGEERECSNCKEKFRMDVFRLMDAYWSEKQ